MIQFFMTLEGQAWESDFYQLIKILKLKMKIIMTAGRPIKALQKIKTLLTEFHLV